MGKAIKFSFNDDFEQEEKDEKDRKLDIIKQQVRAEFDDELEAAKNIAYEKGYQEGLAKAGEANEVALKETTDALNITNNKLLETLEMILKNSSTNKKAYEEKISEFREQAFLIAMTVAQKIAGELLKTYPENSLENAFRETIDYLDDEVRVSISVPPDLGAVSREKLQEVSEQYGYSGKITILEDTSITPGDWKIEWANGGIIKDGQQVENLIEDVVKRYLKSVDITLPDSAKTDEEALKEPGDISE